MHSQQNFLAPLWALLTPSPRDLRTADLINPAILCTVHELVRRGTERYFVAAARRSGGIAKLFRLSDPVKSRL